MSDGLELRWPGKYDEQGQRVPVPRPGATLQRRAVYGPSAPDAQMELGAAPKPADAAGEPAPINRLIEGDNLGALDALVREHAGTVDLVYIDPPFATGGRFDVASPVGPRPPRGKGRMPEVRRPAYTDSWPGGMGGLLGMLDPRLRLVHELMAPHGSLYVHVDPTMGHAIKLLLDEIFGPGCFQREIVWRIGWVSGFKTRARNWIRNHDLLFFYVKDPSRFTFNKRYLPHPPGYRRRDGALPKGKGVPLDDVWNAGDAELALRGRDSLDSIQIKSFSTEKTGYATQKNESLLRRIVEASSNPGDLVADVFCGSGTTLAVAEQLGRRWLGCDVGRSAIHIASARLLAQSRARGFEVCTVLGPADAEQEQRAHTRAEQAWAQLGGEEAPPLRLETAVDAAPRGRKEAVAAWRWSVPVPTVPEDDTILVGEAWPPSGRGAAAAKRAAPQLVLLRALLEPSLPPGPELALAERARVLVRLHGVGARRLSVELCSVVHPHEALLPEAMQSLEDSRHGVEWWTVGWGDGGPADAVMGRFDRDRVLPTRSPEHACPDDTVTLRIRVYDVLHREYGLRCRLDWRRGAWTVTEAVAEAEG